MASDVINLNFINASADCNSSKILIFQKNTVASL